MADEQVTRRLAAIVAIDVAGYSRLMGADEAGTLARLKEHRAVTDPISKAHGGRIVGTAGDGLLLEFPSVVDAVSCMVEVQRVMAERNTSLPDDEKMLYRVGINLGDVLVDGDDIYGDGVNVAARLEGLADPGGVCVSRTVCDHIKGKVDFGFEDLGEQIFKNIREPVQVYRVKPDDTDTQSVALSAAGEALPRPDKPSIAVLPFDNLSADPEQGFFADGIAEDILTTLSKIRHIFVIARNSSFTYKGQSVDVRQVGQELGVQYVLEGSVRKAGNQVRVSAQLIDCLDGHHLWADRFDGSLEDVFELQDRITQDIAMALEVELTEGEQVRIWRKRSGNPLAYEAYHKARELHMQFTRDANLRAIVEATRATEINPEYWDAWVLLGYSHNMAVRFRWSDEPEVSLKQAENCVRQVLNADYTVAEAHSLAGGLALTHGDFDLAIEHGKRAVDLGPNSPDCYHMLAMTQNFAGHPEEAVGLERQALRINPLSPTNSLIELGRAYFHLRRYENARSVLLEVVARRPQWLNAWVLLVAACHSMGSDDEAADHVSKILRMRPSFTTGVWKSLQPYRHSRDLEAILEPLREAGLPE